ncbi:hypothetical protein HDV05_003826, partial [Chytridiales sp. JEL 0842]
MHALTQNYNPFATPTAPNPNAPPKQPVENGNDSDDSDHSSNSSSSVLPPTENPVMSFMRRVSSQISAPPSLEAREPKQSTARKRITSRTAEKTPPPDFGGGGNEMNARKQRGNLGEEFKLSQMKIHGRSSNMSFGLSKYPNAREISETAGLKTKEVSFIGLVVFINILIIIAADKMRTGLRIGLPPSAVHFAGGVAIELALLISNVLTIRAMDTAASIVLAGWLTIVKLLSPIGAIGVTSKVVRDVSLPVDCIVFDSKMVTDRGYPTLTSTAGVAEYIFGNALGCMRSQRTDCLTNSTGSTFIFGPQIQGAIGSGNTIIGPGYQALISIDCVCGNLTSTRSNFNGWINQADRANMLRNLNSTSLAFLYMATAMNISETNGIEHTIVMGNTPVCGGYINTLVPMCKTKIQDAKDILVSSTFLTDGTTASIALVDSQYMSMLPEQSLT